MIFSHVHTDWRYALISIAQGEQESANMKRDLPHWFRAVGKRLGTDSIKTRLWDYENRRYGEFLHETGEGYRSRISTEIEARANGGSILDLGCSDGHVGFSLASDTYALYHGVDLSRVAIQAAHQKIRR